MKRARSSKFPFGRNLLALLVAGATVGIVQINVDEEPAGGSSAARAESSGMPQVLLPPSPALPTAITTATTANESESSDTRSAAPATTDPNVLRGIWSLKMISGILAKGCESFEKVPDYTATMYKQERINGILGEGQTIDLKVRHEPFSVYMKWSSGDRGRQLIYVDGLNDGNMLVQPGGIKGRLTGVMSLEPQSSLALSESRYPITNAGLLELARMVLEYHQADLERGHGFQCQLHDHQEFEGRECYLYICEYDSPEINSLYRKTMLFVDKELSLPICVKNYTWARDVDPDQIEQQTLIEFYAYTDLQLHQQLQTADFDQHNREYRLRVR